MTTRASSVPLAALAIVLAVLQPAGAGDDEAAQISIDAAADNAAPTVGDAVELWVRVTNEGPDAGAVTVSPAFSERLAAGESWVERADGSTERCSTGGCDLGRLEAGEEAVARFVVYPLDAGPHEPSVTVVSDASDPQPAENEASVVLAAAGEACTMTGTAGDDDLVGTPGDDVICALGGDDTVAAGGGVDVLYGGEDNDRLAGGPGDDTVDGGNGNDAVDFSGAVAGVAADLAAGTATGEGADGLTEVEDAIGSAFDDVLRGGTVAGTLDGGAGTDLLYAGAAGTRLFGGGDDDYLEGGPGADTLDGGAQTDTCVWGSEDTAVDCLTFNPSDGNDASGPLDVRSVKTAGRGSWSPRWQVNVRGRVTTRRLWDRGYFLVRIDSRLGPQADYLGLIRGARRSASGFVARPNGRYLPGLRVWRKGRRRAPP